MRAMPLNIGKLHFVGIGGIGMSGIAEVLHAMGYEIQGSDLSESANVLRLREKGMKVFVGHDGSHVKEAAIVIISSAIKDDNPELMEARRLHKTIVRRAEMLAELMRLKWSIAIAGTHGKTTTTTMVGAMLEEAGFDPTVINGGIVNRYGTNTRVGGGDWIVAEADESDGTFTKLPATVAIVTNIDPEHLDHYGSYDNIKAAFRRFIDNLPFYGFAVLCSDHPAVQALIPGFSDRRIVTYGFNSQADVRASNIRTEATGSHFDVHFAPWLSPDKQEKIMRDVFLPMPGDYNILNALSSIAIAHEMGAPDAVIKTALKNFGGVKRRFTKTGESHGVTVIDDYAHHPVEIRSVLKAARQAVEAAGKKVIVVMQPHRYSRLHDLFDEFCSCFNEADHVLIADVYEAGEKPIEGADKEHLAAGIAEHGHKSVQTLNAVDDLATQIVDFVEEGDLVICLGAGSISQWAYALPEQLDEEFQRREKKTA
ncbi:MAG: UDP-N-acetylmuramate--L-alanine ligase [Alphaproteobacteria bacterium]|nr:UDP-N-acetylmuramate--L-alanine ligase [Alphaproteobacteria bacterium]